MSSQYHLYQNEGRGTHTRTLLRHNWFRILVPRNLHFDKEMSGLIFEKHWPYRNRTGKSPMLRLTRKSHREVTTQWGPCNQWSDDSGGPEQRRTWLLENEGNAEHGGLIAEVSQPQPLTWICMPCPVRNSCLLSQDSIFCSFGWKAWLQARESNQSTQIQNFLLWLFEWAGFHKQNEYWCEIKASGMMEDPRDLSPVFGSVTDYSLPEAQALDL